MSLANDNLPFAKYWMAKHRIPAELLTDVYLGMVRAEKSFDPSRGAFSTYAAWWMRSAVTSSKIRELSYWKGRDTPKEDEHPEELLGGELGDQEIRTLLGEVFDYSDTTLVEILRRMAREEPIKEIARKVGVSRSVVEKKVAEAKEAAGYGKPLKMVPKSTSLSLVLKASAEGESLHELSRRLGKSRRWAHDILAKHVGRPSAKGNLEVIGDPSKLSGVASEIYSMRLSGKSFRQIDAHYGRDYEWSQRHLRRHGVQVVFSRK